MLARGSGARAPAVAGMVLVVIVWATQLPLSQEVLRSIDQYYFAILRYLIGCALFVGTLAWREGRAGFALEGRARAVAWHGMSGFTVFGVFVFWALYHTTAAHVSVIMSLQPMLIAFWLWARHGRAPSRPVLACIVTAFAGAGLMITRGDPAQALTGGSLLGDAMAFVGAIGWIVYTLGAARFPTWSPLRYTTLCALAGTLGIMGVAAVLTPLGLAQVPSLAAVARELPVIVYIAVAAFYLAILLFTIAVARLGAVDTLLIGNATPVLVFLIDVWRGLAPRPAEWLGAGMVVAALIAHNLIEGRAARRAAVADGR